MDFYGSDRSPEEEDDDDIVVIQDQKYQHHRSQNDSIPAEDRGGFCSPSQRHESQHEYSRRNVRRRQQQERIPAGTVAVLAASQEEARNLFFGHGEEKASDLLHQSNAFASLESLLNQQQQFDMSMTQEKEGDEEASDDLGEEEQQQANLYNEVPPRELPFERDDQSRVNGNSGNETKENALNFIHLSAYDSMDSALEKPKSTRDSFAQAMTSGASLRAPSSLSPRSETSCPTRPDGNEESSVPMEDDNDDKRQKTLHDLDRELKRQRQRRKAATRNPKPISSNLPRMPNGQPSRALRQHLQKDRQSKKTSRSKSADKIRISRPSKRLVRPRSASPKTRQRVTTPKSQVVEEANRSLVGSRYVP